MHTAPRVRVIPQKLNLTAKGSFRVRKARTTGVRCGPHGTPRTIQYTVTIGSRPDLVDSRGFIIDWRDIFTKVAETYKTVQDFPSCEQFAGEICGLVAELLDGRCANITVEVGINGLPAHMTAEYEAAPSSPWSPPQA